jgi:hypothetical protein
MHGRRTMICLMGCAAVTPQSAVRPPPAPPEVLAKLPPNLARHLAGPFEVNDSSNTIIDRIYKERPPASIFSLEYWSRLERRFAEWLTDRLAKA